MSTTGATGTRIPGPIFDGNHDNAIWNRGSFLEEQAKMDDVETTFVEMVTSVDIDEDKANGLFPPEDPIEL